MAEPAYDPEKPAQQHNVADKFKTNFSPRNPSEGRRRVLNSLAQILSDHMPEYGLSAEDLQQRFTADRSLTHSKIDRMVDDAKERFFPDVDDAEFRRSIGYDQYEAERPGMLRSSVRGIPERIAALVEAESRRTLLQQQKDSRREREAFEAGRNERWEGLAPIGRVDQPDGKVSTKKSITVEDERLGDGEWEIPSMVPGNEDWGGRAEPDITEKEIERAIQYAAANPGVKRRADADAAWDEHAAELNRIRGALGAGGERLLASKEMGDEVPDLVESAAGFDFGSEVYRDLDDMFRSPGDFALGSVEMAIKSLADMALILNPATLLPYTRMRASEISLERMTADARGELSIEDVVAGTGAAVIVSTLDKIGLTRLLGKRIAGDPSEMLFRTRAGARKAPQEVAAEIGKRIGAETGLEAAQEMIEYAAATAGTERGASLGEALKMGAAGAGAGAVTAAAVTGAKGAVEARKQLRDAAGLFLTDEEVSQLQEFMPRFEQETGLSGDAAFIAMSDAYRKGRHVARAFSVEGYKPNVESILAIHNKEDSIAQQAQAEARAQSEDAEAAEDMAPGDAAADPREQWNVNLVEQVEADRESWHIDAGAISDEVAERKRQQVNPFDMEQGQEVVVIEPGGVQPAAATVTEVTHTQIQGPDGEPLATVYVRVQAEDGREYQHMLHQGRRADDPFYVTRNPEVVKQQEKEREAEAAKPDYDAEARRIIEGLKRETTEDGLQQLKRLRGKDDWYMGLEEHQRDYLDEQIRVTQDKIDAAKAAEKARQEALKAEEEAKPEAGAAPSPEAEAEPAGNVFTVNVEGGEWDVEADTAEDALKQAIDEIKANPAEWGLSEERPRLPVRVARGDEVAEGEATLGEPALETEAEPEVDPFEEAEAGLAALEEEFAGIIDEEARKPGDTDEDVGVADINVAGQEARADMEAVRQAREDAAKSKSKDSIDQPRFQVLAAQDVVIDAERFQFKRSDKKGKTGRLGDVERWNYAAAGILTVWKSKDGKHYVVDGHQRVNLAHELEARGHPPIALQVRVLDEKDMTAEEAYNYGAEINLGQGSATALDAARVLKAATPENREDLLRSFRDANMRHGASLAKLEAQPFQLYQGYFYNTPNPKLTPGLAAAIGEAAPAGTENAAAIQTAILKDMLDNPPANQDEAMEFAREFVAHATGANRQQDQQGLFGAEQIAESALRERAQIKAGVLRNAKRFARIFKSLASNQAVIEAVGGNVIDEAASMKTAQQSSLIALIIDKEANRAGSPISAALTQLAMALKEGRISKNEAIERFYQAITAGEEAVGEIVSAEGVGGAAGEAQPTFTQAGQQSIDEIDRLSGELGLDGIPDADPNDSLFSVIRGARIPEVQALEQQVDELSAMSNRKFLAYMRAWTTEMGTYSAKIKGGTHLTGTEQILYRQLAKLRPFIKAEFDRRKEGGDPIPRKLMTPDMNKALAFLQSTDSELADEAIAQEIEIGDHLAADTAELLDRGTAAGIPAAVTHDQAEDAAAIVKAFKDGLEAFVLALPPGAGKTYVMAAAVRELRRLRTDGGRRRVNRILYVSTAKTLLDQNREDFEPFMAGVDGAEVQFETYTKLRDPDNEDSQRIMERFEETQGTVLILDESHHAKGQRTPTSRAVSRLMEAADFTVAASGTPFTDPKDAHYLAPSGVFEPMGGFDEWAREHGVSITILMGEDGSEHRTYSAEHVTEEDILNARRSLMEAGMFAYRPKRLDPALTAIEFVETEINEVQGPGMQALYSSMFIAGEAARRDARSERARNTAAMWVKNKLKRVTEQAKIQKAIEIAETALEGGEKGEKPQVIVFTETRSATQIGRWRFSEFFEPSLKKRMAQDFTYPEMEPMQSAARAADHPLPFSPGIFALARRFHEMGIQAELPSVLDAFKERFSDDVVEYTGEVSAEQRIVRRKLFNEGKKRVMIATVAAGGTGLSLHDVIGQAPRTVVFLSMPWDAITLRQALERATRYGMKSKVDIKVPYASNMPIEQVVAVRQARRAVRMGLLLSGKPPAISDKIRDVVEGEEKLLPASRAGPLRDFVAGREMPGGYKGGQTEIAAALRRILRLGVRHDTRLVADVGSWLEEIGDGAAIDDREKEALAEDGLGGFLRVQRQKALAAILDLVEDGEADRAYAVIDDLATYLATRPASDYYTHSNDYNFDVKGLSGSSLEEVLRSWADENVRKGETRAQIVYHSSPTRGIRKFDNAFMGEGEGVQAYGWGMYFSDPGGVTEHYKEKFGALKVGIRRGLTGTLFSPNEVRNAFREDLVGHQSVMGGLGERLKAAKPGVRSVRGAILEEIGAQIEKQRFDMDWSQHAINSYERSQGPMDPKLVRRFSEDADLADQLYRAVEHLYDNKPKDTLTITIAPDETPATLGDRLAAAYGLDPLLMRAPVVQQQLAALAGSPGFSLYGPAYVKAAVLDALHELRSAVYELHGAEYAAARQAMHLIEIKRLERLRERIEGRKDREFVVRVQKVRKGAQYEVELAEELDGSVMRWDDPLLDQPKAVKAAIGKIIYDYDMDVDPDAMGNTLGSDFYKRLADTDLDALDGTEQAASELLLAYGVRGHKFKGGHQEGGFNYVLFDAGADATIIDERNARIDSKSPAWKLLSNPKAWDSPADDPAIEHGMAEIIERLHAENELMTGGRAKLRIERGLFPHPSGLGWLSGSFNTRSHILQVAVDPFFGMDEKTRQQVRANPAIMAKLDPIPTLGHEAIHALFETKAIPDADRAILERAAVAQGWIEKHNIKRNYGDQSEAVQLEEAIAHEFAQYIRTREARPRIAKVFERVREFFRRLFGLLRREGYSVNARAEAVFLGVALGDYGAHADRPGRAKPQPLDPDDPRSVLPAKSQRAVVAAGRRIISTASASKQVLAAAMECFHRWTRAFALVPKTADNAPLLEALRLLKGASARAAVTAQGIFDRIAKGLTDKQLNILNAKLWAEDLMWTHEQGKRVGFHLEEDQEDGRTAKERLLAVILMADAAIAKDPVLQERLKLRDREREKLRVMLVDSGVLTPESARNPKYYAHRVIKYVEEEGLVPTVGGGEKLATPRVWQREGSWEDISLNYAQVETQWMTTALHDIAIQKFLNWLADSPYNFRPALAQRAKDMNEMTATEALRAELERAGFAGVADDLVRLARRPVELKWAVKRWIKETEGGQPPSPELAPLYLEYSRIATRLASESHFLELETRDFLASPGRLVDGVPPVMWRLMRELERGEWPSGPFEERDGDEATVSSFPSFEVAQWAVQPDSPASPGMKQAAGAFLKAADARKELMKLLVGESYINTTSTMAIHRALDKEGKYRTWQPDAEDGKRVKLTIRNGKTLEERAYEQLMGMLAKGDEIATDAVREWAAHVKDGRVMGAPTRMLILPREVADTLDRFHAKQVESRVSWLMGRVNRFMRRWVLFMPKRVVKFNLNNTSGDAEAWVMNQSLSAPEIWRRHLKEAARMMGEFRRTGQPSPALKDALEYDVLQSSYVQMQVGEPSTEEVMPGAFMRKPKSWVPGVNLVRGIGQASFSASKWRENVFRLAPYLHLREQFENAGMVSIDTLTNEPLQHIRDENLKRLRDHVGYGSTPRWAREGLILHPEVLAARMARDAMGDYSDITEMGEMLDRAVLWFWRWKETNIRRTYNNAKNAWMLPWDQWKHSELDKRRMYQTIGRNMGLGTLKLGKTFLKAAYFYSKFALYGAVLYYAARGAEGLIMDEDDHERARRQASGVRPHVPLATDEESDLRYEYRLPGAMYDALQWIGFENAWFAAQDARMGLRPWSDVLWEVAKGPVNVLASGLSAFYKTGAEVITGYRVWPDAFSPRPVGDRAEHLARTLALDHEYRALVGREGSQAYIRSWWVALLGISAASSEQEYRGADYEAAERAEEEFGHRQLAKLRRDIRGSAIRRNWKLHRRSVLAFLGMGETQGDLVDVLRHVDPAYGRRADVKAVMEAMRLAEGRPRTGQKVARDFLQYWRDNPVTEAEKARIKADQAARTERSQRYARAVRARALEGRAEYIKGGELPKSGKPFTRQELAALDAKYQRTADRIAKKHGIEPANVVTFLGPMADAYIRKAYGYADDVPSHRLRKPGGLYEPYGPESGKAEIALATDHPYHGHVFGHEMWHWLASKGPVTPKEASALYHEAERLDWIGRFKIRERYPHLPARQQMEEAVAEGFGEFFQKHRIDGLSGRGAEVLRELLDIQQQGPPAPAPGLFDLKPGARRALRKAVRFMEDVFNGLGEALGAD